MNNCFYRCIKMHHLLSLVISQLLGCVNSKKCQRYFDVDAKSDTFLNYNYINHSRWFPVGVLCQFLYKCVYALVRAVLAAFTSGTKTCVSLMCINIMRTTAVPAFSEQFLQLQVYISVIFSKLTSPECSYLLIIIQFGSNTCAKCKFIVKYYQTEICRMSNTCAAVDQNSFSMITLYAIEMHETNRRGVFGVKVRSFETRLFIIYIIYTFYY